MSLSGLDGTSLLSAQGSVLGTECSLNIRTGHRGECGHACVRMRLGVALMIGSAHVQGELWGNAPRDWVEIQDGFSIPLWETALDALGVKVGTRFLDAGCGAGGACALALRRGAAVYGVGASAGLLQAARERVPDGDFRQGDLEDLPYTDVSFDAVFACNSLQYCSNQLAALRELRRVCAAGGTVAVCVWGRAEDCEMREVLIAIAQLLPRPPSGEDPFALSSPGVLDELLAHAGLRISARGEVDCPFYYPDLATLWRGVRSSGPLEAAVRVAGEDPVRRAVLDAVQPFRTSGDGVRLDNRFVYIIAKP